MSTDAHEFLVIDSHSSSGLVPDYVPLLKQGGVGAYGCPIGWMKSARNTLDDIAFLYAQLEATAQETTLVTSAAEIEAAVKAGKIGVILTFENTLPLDGDLHMVDLFYRLGLRLMQLTYNERNLVGDGCTERTDAGLSDFGVQVVERMNKLGMVVSLSHTGKRTCLDAMEVSQAPVVFTHSNARALCNHPRNIDDELIEAVARKGGVIGVNAIVRFVRAGATAENPVTIDDVLNHADYLVQRAGIDHVGLGLDLMEFWDAFTATGVMSERSWPPERMARIFKPAFGTWAAPDRVQGLASVIDIPNLIEGLVHRGYSREAVTKILGGNFLRVFRDVWGQ
jgi:membrane dipeptidase